MKKIIAVFIILFMTAIIGYRHYADTVLFNNEKTIYLNAYDDYQKLKKLKSSLAGVERPSYLAKPGKHKSGKFNLYTAADIHHLPEVIDRTAINILWLDTSANNEDVEPLRPFDVVVVKSMPAYLHLRAINMRTAYIPDAVDLDIKDRPAPEKNAMFYGNSGKEPSLSLYLAAQHRVSLDVFGKDYEAVWRKKDIIAETPRKSTFAEYKLVLADQNEEEIKTETVNAKIIEIIANGGLPYVRYNPGVDRMFGDIIPMYHNEDEFFSLYQRLIHSPRELQQRRDALKAAVPFWNSRSQGKKFIELFEIMEKKRIYP